MSKLYTAVAVLQLVERGVIGLHDPVRRHLPDLAIVNPLGDREITVDDLLTFRSGLAVDTTAAHVGAVPSLHEHLQRSYAEPVLHEYGSGISRWRAKVGERYQYSNLGVATLGRLVEVVNPEGRGFCDHVTKAVLEPLGTTSSAFLAGGSAADLPSRLRDLAVRGYARFGRQLVETPVIRSADYPANGLFATVSDHLKLLIALRAGGGHILRPESVRLMLTPRAPIGDARISADGSWQVGLVAMLGNVGRPDAHFGHPGAHMWGWWSLSRAYSGMGLSVVMATNAWDMLRWHDPTHEEPTTLLADAIALWAGADEDLARVRARRSAQRSWSWKRSYAAGVLMAERTAGLLGIDAEAARPALEDLVVDPWMAPDLDRRAFRRGLCDVLAAPPTTAGVRELLASPRCAIAPHELDLLFVTLGSRRELPIPLCFCGAG